MPRRLFTFYALVVTQTLSFLGSRMTTVAVGIFVFNQTGQTTPLLLTAFFTELPGMLGASLAGVLVDRWHRKHVLILADLGQALGSLLLLLSFASERFQLWYLYVAALLQGTFATLQGPAESATVTLLIPEQQRERANAIQELAFPLAGILGPVLSGLFYGPLGVKGILALDLATFVLAAVVVALLSIPRPPATAEGAAGQGQFLAELRVGLRFLRAQRALWHFILYASFINFMLNGPLALVIPYVSALTGDETQTGLALGLMSLGALSGAALVAVIGRYRPRMRLILLGSVLNGLMFLFFGVFRSLPAVIAALFILMIPLPANNALFRSILQLKIPPDLQGRVFAVITQLALLGSTLSFLLVGPLVDRLLRPAVGSSAWSWVAPFVGRGPAAAIGLVQVATGLILLAATGLIFGRRDIRRLEALLPDYVATPIE